MTMTEPRNVVTYGRKGKSFRVRAWRDNGDCGLGTTLSEGTYSSLRLAVIAAKTLAEFYNAEFSEAEMTRYFA